MPSGAYFRLAGAFKVFILAPEQLCLLSLSLLTEYKISSGWTGQTRRRLLRIRVRASYQYVLHAWADFWKDVFLKLVYALFGVYVWELFVTCDFEWSLLTRQRIFRWPLVRRRLITRACFDLLDVCRVRALVYGTVHTNLNVLFSVLLHVSLFHYVCFRWIVSMTVLRYLWMP